MRKTGVSDAIVVGKFPAMRAKPADRGTTDVTATKSAAHASAAEATMPSTKMPSTAPVAAATATTATAPSRHTGGSPENERAGPNRRDEHCDNVACHRRAPGRGAS